MKTQPQKVCPVCQAIAPMAAPECLRCRHSFERSGPPPPPTARPVQQQVPVAHSSPMPPMHPGQLPFDVVQAVPGTHSAGLALFLSFLLVGAGQMYNKQVVKGIVMLVATIGLCLMMNHLIWLAMVVLGIADAYVIGQRLNRGELVGTWQFF